MVRQQTLRVIAGRVAGASLLAWLAFGWVDNLTKGGVYEFIGVPGPLMSGPEPLWGQAQLATESAFYVAMLCGGLLAGRGLRPGKWAFAVAAAAMVVLGLAWARLGPPMEEHGVAAAVDQLISAALFGLAWWAAGAGLTWRGKLPAAVTESTFAEVAITALLVAVALLLAVSASAYAVTLLLSRPAWQRMLSGP